MTGVVDLILVGGGLANGLLAFRLRQLRPELKVLVIEQGQRLGGNHTWSYHSSDMTTEQRLWMTPLVTAHWSQYEVKFPEFERTVQSSYYSVSSDQFHGVVSEALGANLISGHQVIEASPHRVLLDDGRSYESLCVLDGRGIGAVSKGAAGFQKFIGWDITLEMDHGLTCPTLMDATVPQEGGFRFIYLLPWAKDRLLIEDTRYSNDPGISEASFEDGIRDYLSSRGWRISSIDRREQGVLPIPLVEIFSDQGGQTVPATGTRAGFFHPTTGYSLALAVQIADGISSQVSLTPQAVSGVLEKVRKKHRRNAAFYRFLNRMLLLGAGPEERYKIFKRFYQMSPELIQRFYSGNSTFLDRVRILSGAPPIPIHKAALCIFERTEVLFEN